MHKKQDFSRITAYIHKEHLKKLNATIDRRQGLTKKAIIYSALEEYFDPLPKEGSVESIEKLLFDIKRDIKRIKGTQEALVDMFSVFVRVWLSHIPEVPEEERAAAEASMHKRFEKYKELVLSELGNSSALWRGTL